MINSEIDKGSVKQDSHASSLLFSSHLISIVSPVPGLDFKIFVFSILYDE